MGDDTRRGTSTPEPAHPRDPLAPRGKRERAGDGRGRRADQYRRRPAPRPAPRLDADPVPPASAAVASATTVTTATTASPAPRETPGDTSGDTAGAQLAPWVRRVPWLAVVAVGYALVQLALVVPPLAHVLGWDESVYVSQYDPRMPTAFFSAPRSRGISFLTAPIVAATSSALVLRIALALLSSAALYAAFRVWRTVVGARTTALAALLFAGLWVTELYGPQAMPNLWVAFAAVAATGWFLRAVLHHEPRAGLWLAGCVAATALFRASDVVWLTLPLFAVALFRGRRMLPHLVGGVVLGLAQWVAEAFIRFGSVQGRLHVSSATEGTMRPNLNFANAWRSLDGPLLCRPCTATMGEPALGLWWLVLPVLALAALAFALRERRVLRTALPIACAAALAVPYLLLLDYSAPRFLLPAYALLALPVAGLVTRLRSRPVLVAVGLVVVAQLLSQGDVLTRVTASTAATDQRYRAAADDLRSLGLRPPCVVSGPRAIPIAYAGGCESAEVSGNNKSTSVTAFLDRAAKVPTAVLTEKGQRPPRYARDWTPYPLPHTPHWTAWVAPAGSK